MARYKKRIDIVYILSNESKWQDKEIMYSIRSVEKFVHSFGKIFIIGRKPLFFNDKVIEIPYEDVFVNKARNIKAKIRRAAADKRISEDFVLMNDDYFFLKPVENLAEYPYYFKCYLKESIHINRHNMDYLPHLVATNKLLRDSGLPTKNFDTHYPIVYNKKKMIEICDQLNWEIPDGYIMKSLYCNWLQIDGVQREDCKINHPHIFANWPGLTVHMDFLSIGDRSINRSMDQFLFSLFPKKSAYEHQ